MRRWMGLVLVVMGWGLGGCSLLEHEGPKTVRLRLEGDGAARLQLVTSLKFLAQRQPVYGPGGVIVRDTLLVLLLEADTTRPTIPLERQFDISQTRQIFIRVERQNPELDNLRMRVWIDDRLDYDATPPARQRVLQFVYFYRSSQDTGPIVF
ncbi:MAG: hypothetical protein N2561_04845 [Bacteroidetes bacterium]|nr:hypothetical protein [Rhodothermia bacterium]MCS7154474.1 hypothetical protein [Bacteroidota bacterium]MCX7906847.1 hypothetical protein [Bacteroidota bacterium]MDW8136874.1 hypothetical protein [Bacteroidota bacterium]MDW8285256.1 hypothetical protein [Bacteroidota bacterium]